jgi:RimJ/RimL family protein N-acetyltransferase
MSSSPSFSQIVAPAAEQQADALRLIFAGLANADREAHLETVRADVAAGRTSLDGLRAIVTDGRVTGAVWAAIEPGRTAAILPPQVADGEPRLGLTALVAEALRFARAGGATMAQTLVERGAPTDWLAANRFEWLADLEFMTASLDWTALFDSIKASPEPPLEWDFYRPDQDRARLADLLEATYQETLDCPGLDGLRRIDHVIEGYLRTGTHVPSWWRILRHEGTDVGCVLLADHPREDRAELLYMGLIREYRGRGWGCSLVRGAMQLALEGARRQLMLAVDARNEPAVRAYVGQGFRTWQERSAWVRALDS